MQLRSIHVGAGIWRCEVLLAYVVTEEERSPARFRLSLNRRPMSSFSSELAAVNTARAHSAAHASDQAVVISVRRLDGEVRVVESSLAAAKASTSMRSGSFG